MDGSPPRHLHPVDHQGSADDDYKAAAKSTKEVVDYKQYMPKLKAEHKALKRLAKLLITIVVVAGLGAGAYFYGMHIAAKSPSAVNKTATTVSSNKTATTKQYTSNYQDLSFNYSANWKVTETTDVITATSPATKLTSYNHQAFVGQIVLQVRDSNVALNEFSSGPATAILPSQLITYTAPAAGQRASTYISFLNYASSKGNGIDGIYITGNTGYQAGQDAPETDIQAVDPVISLTFVKCANKACSGKTTPLTIATSSWNTKDFSGPLLAVLESLSIS